MPMQAIQTKGNWYAIVPFAGGYLGTSKQGQFFGKTRMDVIRIMLERAYQK